MRSPLARAIRDARLSLRLTQDQLGMRLGLKGRAVYRWERGVSAPTRRHQRALLTAVQAIDPSLAAKLQAELVSSARQAQGLGPPAPAPPPPVPAKPTGPVALELAVFAAADELDLTPRRLRAALVKLCARLMEGGFSLESAQRQLEVWIASVQEANGAP
jgi:transcriptional regulator with XRE-family HTH domain